MFPFEFPEIFKCFSEVCNELVMVFCLDNDVIDIGLGVALDLPLEASLNDFLVSGTCVLEAEHHGVIAVGPQGGDEGRLLLIRLLEGYLMVP